MSLEAAFEKLNQRPPSPEELRRLLRFRDAFDLRENDAFWWVLLALDHYEALYAEYPEKLGVEAERLVASAERALTSVVRRERSVAKGAPLQGGYPLGGALSSAVWLCFLCTGTLVLFGSLCVSVGFSMAKRGSAPWLAQGDGHHGLELLGTLLGAPAGWMIFAIFLGPACCTAHSGWLSARDELSTTKERAAGLILLALSIGAAAACACLLVTMLKT